VCQSLAIDPAPLLVFKETERGGVVRTRTAAGTSTTLTLPMWTFGHGEAFVKYYLIHECTHVIINSPKHDLAFKTAEAKHLTEVFNIGIKYSRAFPKYLFCTETKKVLWGRSDKTLGLGPCLRRLFRGAGNHRQV
jgi:hypothetical protein